MPATVFSKVCISVTMVGSLLIFSIIVVKLTFGSGQDHTNHHSKGSSIYLEEECDRIRRPIHELSKQELMLITCSELPTPPKPTIKWHSGHPWISVKVRKWLNGDTIGILFFIHLKGNVHKPPPGNDKNIQRRVAPGRHQ